MSPLQSLAGNLAVVALFVLGWAHARYWLRNLPGFTRSVVFGLLMGCGTIATMLMAAEIAPGRFADLRGSLLVLSSFFGGPVAGTISTIIALCFRTFMGGTGLMIGGGMIITTAAVGLLMRWLTRHQHLTALHGLALGCSVALVNIASILFFPAATGPVPFFFDVSLPMALLNLVGTTLSAGVIIQARRLASERDLMAAALTQAPDFNYIKDVHSRFAAVNLAVARLYGQSDPDALVGLTDFDVAPPDRANELFADEQRIMSSGVPMLDKEELLSDNTGKLRWFNTSKVPLYDGRGRIIGLAGVTRDVSADKQLRTDLTESRDLLSFALAEMADGLAMFDIAGRLVFCNDQYRESFPLTAAVRTPGTHITDILRASVESGEQLFLPDDHEAWIAQTAANLAQAGEEEIALFDGRWLQLRTRPTPNGSTIVVASDITRIKQAELALQTKSDRLKQMARTDSLTGLLNRRAFDDTLDTELRRTARASTPLSLLIIDIDRFKAFNDRYGHPVGDACLRQVAELLRDSLKRPGDSAARYGGEEFAAILPDTDEDAAYRIAEGFRQALAVAHIPHLAAERGYVTASIGVATYDPKIAQRSAAEIIVVADEMLYGAKAAGRDRVLGTRLAGKERRYATG